MADEFLLRQIERWRRLHAPHWWQMVATGMATSAVIPVGPGFQDVIKVLLANDANAVEYLVLQRPEHSLHECLQVR